MGIISDSKQKYYTLVHIGLESTRYGRRRLSVINPIHFAAIHGVNSKNCLPTLTYFDTHSYAVSW